MGFRSRVLLVIFLLAAAAVAAFFLFRPRTQAAFGPAVALCPGPDQYGYTCGSGAGFAYIDATLDTQLYADDGTVSLALPFPFTFYGTTYTEVQASSNGNLQFGSSNPAYANLCLSGGPAPEMGDMISPYWDDLDLTLYGFLETEITGTAPERIFTIEWDSIPRYGNNPDDRVTFEVQLFEGSNDILFLYEEVSTFDGHNGSSATIGLQSEVQGMALQYNCEQPAVADAGAIFFPFPETPNEAVGQETVVQRDGALVELPAKGLVAELLARLEQEGAAALPQLGSHWLSQTPPRAGRWHWLDVTGDSRSELLVLWHSTRQYPQLTQLALLGPADGEQMRLLLEQRLSSRQEQLGKVEVIEAADVTGEGQVDVLLGDKSTGQLFLLTAASDEPALLAVPERCSGSLGLIDVNGDGQPELVRDGCREPGRLSYTWDGGDFVPLKK